MVLRGRMTVMDVVRERPLTASRMIQQCRDCVPPATFSCEATTNRSKTRIEKKRRTTEIRHAGP